MSILKRIIAAAAAICVLAFSCPVSASETTDLADTGSDIVFYINGDADGDSVITIIDATVIQRVLVGQRTDPDGMIALRGDVNKDGLEITDVTFIQRYLADFPDENKIGVEMNKVIGGGVELPEDEL